MHVVTETLQTVMTEKKQIKQQQNEGINCIYIDLRPGCRKVLILYDYGTWFQLTRLSYIFLSCFIKFCQLFTYIEP